jgi:hypothetical protein
MRSYLVTMKLRDGSVRAFLYPTIRDAQEDACIHGANIQSVHPTK